MLRARTLRTLTLEGGGHVSAASGIARCGDRLFVVSDDEHHLAVFDCAGDRPGRLVRLLPGDLPAAHAERKAAKPDFEALVALPGGAELLALGSGSTPARERGVRWPIEGGAPRVVDLAPLYERLRRHVPELNVEGACVAGEHLVLLLRGANLVARVALEGWQIEDLRAYELADDHGFTDGSALADGAIVFSAAAEDTPNAYDDGPVSGSAVGVIGPAGELEWMAPLAPAGLKVEGIDAEPEGGQLRLLMVCDADDRTVASPLLTTRVRRTPAPA